MSSASNYGFKLDTDPVTLTERQRELLVFVHTVRERDGVAPSLVEIAEAMGCSVPGVANKVATLAGKGLLTKMLGVCRSFRVTAKGLEAIGLAEGGANAHG